MRRVPVRLIVQLLISAGLLALAAAILVPLWRIADAGLAGVRDGLVLHLEERLGRDVSYSSISPSIFGAFDIRGVVISGEGEEPVLTVSRFRVAYSFRDLVAGRTLTVRSVRLDAPVIDLNTARDDDLFNLLETLRGGGLNGYGGHNGRGFALRFRDRVDVQIRGGRFILSGGGGRLQMDAFNLNSGIEGSQVSLDGRWNVALTAAQPLGPPVAVQVAMHVQGSACTDLASGGGFFSVPAVSGDAVSMAPLTFDLAFADGLFSAVKVPGLFPVEMSLCYRPSDGSIDASFAAGDFRPGGLFSFTGGLEAFAQFLEVSVSGAAALHRDAYGELDYSLDFAGASGGGATLAVSVTGNGRAADVHELRFFVPETGTPGERFFGSAAFRGQVALDPPEPAGVLSVDGFSVAGMREIGAEVAIRSGDGRIYFASGDLRVGDSGTLALGASLQPGGGGTSFNASLVLPAYGSTGGGTAGGLAELYGFFDSRAGGLEADLALRSFPLRGIAEIATPRNFVFPPGLLPGGGTSVTADVSLRSDADGVFYAAPAVVLYGGNLGGRLSFYGSPGTLAIGESRLVLDGDELLFYGGADFGAGVPAVFSLNAGYRGERYFLTGSAGSGSLTVSGSGGLDLSLAPRSGGGHYGRLYAEGFPIPFLGRPALLSVRAALDAGADGWRLDLAGLEVEGIDGPAGNARMSVAGTVGADASGAGRAELSELFYQDAVGPLSGSAEVFWGDGVSWNFSVGAGSESYVSRGSLYGGGFEASVYGSRMRLYRFAGAFRNVTADGELHLARPSGGGFSAEVLLPAVSGRLGIGDFTGGTRAVLRDGRVTLDGLRADVAGITASVPALTLDIAAGTLDGTASFDGLLLDRPLAGGLALTAGFAPVSSWAEAPAVLRGFYGRAEVTGFTHDGNTDWQDFAFDFRRENGNIAVSGGPRNMLRFRMDDQYNLFLALSSPFPVRGSIIGTIRDGRIDARCNDLFIDLAGLFAVLRDSDQFFISDGYVTASFDIRGTLRDPEFHGLARGTSARIHVPDFVAREIRPVPFTAVIDGDEIRFGPVPSAVGGGAGMITGLFRFERWVPGNFSLDIAVPRESPIPFAMNLTGFSARGDASGFLNVSMENSALYVSGDLVANNATLGVDTEEIGERGEPFADARRPFTVDMTVTSGSAVDFFFPSPQFPIVRATPEMGTVVQIFADSVAQRYSVNSDVRIRGGEVFYFQRSFYIRSGLLVFRENEMRFEPRLTTRAEIRDRTADGPVTLSMVVENEPVTTFTARFESSPPLSQVEIFTLLGHSLAGGHPGAGGEIADPMMALVISGTDMLAQFTVVRTIEQYIRNLTRLDMFSVRTQALQNWLFTMIDGVNPQVDTNRRLGNYFDNTTIFGGRYFGQNMFVQGMLSIRHDAVAGGLTLQPDIGFDLQGPTINNYDLRIRWDFTPTSTENWFVNDNSVTLTLSRLF